MSFLRTLSTIVLLGTALHATAAALPELNINPKKVSISGISSGAYMAQQLHMAYGERFMAAAILAGGPYYCAENSVGIALTRCMKPTAADQPDAQRLAWITDTFAQQGSIAATHNVTHDRVWIFSGTLDSVVYQAVSDSLVDYYQHFINPDQITYVNDLPAEHSMPTDDFGYACDHTGASSNPDDHFINNCGYDAAGELLKYSYRRLKKEGDKNTLNGRFVTFEQDAHIDNPNAHGMATQGVAYIPKQCDQGARCKLHVALHGCLQSIDRIGDIFYRNAGYNEWADRNKMVVLYPQATASLHEGNGNGCWDWWGYDDADYATRYGRQIQAIMSMVDTLSAADDGSEEPAAPSGLHVLSQLTSTATLAWNGSPEASSYTIYHSEVSGGPYLQVEADAIIDQSISLTNLTPGKHYYVVVSVDASGLEGGPSNEISVSVPGL